MAFNANEISRQAGRPVELYKVERSTQRLYYTSAKTDFVYSGRTYTAAPITRSDIEANNSEERGQLKIRVPRDNPIAEMFRPGIPSDVVTVTVYRIHVGDTDAKVIWMGRILSPSWTADGWCLLSCEPVTTSLKRNGLRRVYQRSCPHRLYGPACNVNKATWQQTVAIQAVASSTITCNTAGLMAAGYLKGGTYTWTNADGLDERRMIMDHVGTTLTLSSPIYGMTGPTSAVVAPGCDHSTGAGGCGKFNNLNNYGGMPYLPTKNPFGGTPVY